MSDDFVVTTDDYPLHMRACRVITREGWPRWEGPGDEATLRPGQRT